MDKKEYALKKHEQWAGKLETTSRANVSNNEELAVAYTPGVAWPCLEIEKDVDLSYKYTRRWNTVAVVTDGTAVLGLGDIGPEAGMPVMEGKCVLFKEFGDVDAVPLCIRSKEVDDIVNTVKLLAGSFGGINLEDISAPRCFEIEKRLKEECDIPIFHDDQHGTAVVTVAGLKNAMKLVKKKPEDVKVVMSGAGAAGVAIIDLMIASGYKNFVVCNRNGALSRDVTYENESYNQLTKITNHNMEKGKLADVIVGADIFIGVSMPGVLTGEMVKTMNTDPIIFAMANPVPEIMPDIAKEAGAKVIATGRSDFPNQINNVLAFPGIFRGTFDIRGKDITQNMKIAAAEALADMVGEDELSPDYIIPSAFTEGVAKKVGEAVAKAGIKDGVNRI